MNRRLTKSKWLDIFDAAADLGLLTGDPTTAADMLGLALDGEITLSVTFYATVYGLRCVPVEEDEEPNDDQLVYLVDSGRVRAVEGEGVKNLSELAEVWDLPLIGNEYIDVEYLYQECPEDPRDYVREPVWPELRYPASSAFFVTNQEGEMYAIQSPAPREGHEQTWQVNLSPEDFTDTPTPPGGFMLCVRREELYAYNKRLEDAKQKSAAAQKADVTDLLDLCGLVEPTEQKKRKAATAEQPLGERERGTLLTIIAVLLAQLTSGKLNDAAVIVQAIADYEGKPGVSKRNMEKVFAAAKRSLNAD
jgi:hypothetical protein